MDYKRRYLIYLVNNRFLSGFGFLDKYVIDEKDIIQKVIITNMNGMILFNEKFDGKMYLILRAILHDPKNQIIIFDNDFRQINMLHSYYSFLINPEPPTPNKIIDLRREYVKHYRSTDDLKGIVEADTPEDAVNEIFKLYKKLRKHLSYSAESTGKLIFKSAKNRGVSAVCL